MNVDELNKLEFQPNIFHPFYFIRNGLYKNIQEFSSSLKGKLLDFGCGSKPYKHLFQVEKYIGADFENPGHSHEQENIDVFYDGKQLPFDDNYFDSILCSEVFEHVFNLDEVLKELHRVLQSNGKMLITCPFVWSEHEVPHDFARYTQFALTDILKKNGFEIIAFKKSGNFITAITQLSVLYFFKRSSNKIFSFFIFRWVLKMFCYALPNIIGKICNAILPNDDTLYLNNILLVEKLN